MGQHPKFEPTPHFASATADDGSPIRNRGLMALLSPRMQQRLAKDGEAVTPAATPRLSMRFKDDRHGHVRVLAERSKNMRAGKKMTGAVERLAVGDWEEARGTPSGTAGAGATDAADRPGTAEPLVVLGGLKCAPTAADI
jgi:hypothetical protein